MSRILVTGANGFIGSHLVRKLLELKNERQWEEEIVCMVRSTSNISSLKGLDVKLIIGDLREPESLVTAVAGATYIYHLAADGFTVNNGGFMESIAWGTENLLKAAVQNARNSLKRFLFVSARAAAGGAADKTPITEDSTPSTPISRYGEAKLEAEKIAKQYMSELPITIVRPCDVYGERSSAFYRLYKTVKMRIHPLAGFRKRYTNMIYVKDLVEGMVAATQHPDTTGETYYLSNPEIYSFGRVNNIMAAAMGKPRGLPIPFPLFIYKIIAVIKELFYLFLRGTPFPTRDNVRCMSEVYRLCSPAKAKEHFHWQSEHSLPEGMKATCDFYKEEERKLKEMPREPREILWLKYFLFSLVVGGIMEALAAFGNLYTFTPWWIVFFIVPVFWGVVFGSLAKITRTFHFGIQFLVGFLLLLGLELLNHYYVGLWKFDYFYGIEDPVNRGMVVGAGAGILLIFTNACMKQFYKWRLRPD